MKLEKFFAMRIFGVGVLSAARPVAAADAVWPAKTHYHYAKIKGQNIFYREAGDPARPTIILLHGFPSSSHTYRELIPLLSGRFHVIAPDHLGSGYSTHADPATTAYTFDLLAEYVLALIKQLEIEDYVLYMQDFGAPVGYRVMMSDPARVRGIIAQNANAYLEGMTEDKQAFFRSARQDRSEENVAKLFEFVGARAVKNNQYLRDVKGRPEIMSPDSWTHDNHFLEGEEDRAIQVQLFQDYYTNLLAYPDWQTFLRERQPPALVVWGKNDPVFRTPGAIAYLNDLPHATVHLLDAGHFAVEECPVDIAQQIISFMESLPE